MSGTNYADFEGIHSVAAAIIFSVLYLPLAGVNVFQAIRLKNRLYFVLTLFCTLRCVAFALRAALAGSSAAAHNLSLFIAEQVLYNVGFYGVLSSAYTLCLDRQVLANTDYLISSFPAVLRTFNTVLRTRRLVQLVLITAVVISIVAVVEFTSSNASDVHTGNTLRPIPVYIFIAVIAFLIIQSLLLVVSERVSPIAASVLAPSYPSRSAPMNAASGFGAAYGALVLVFIALLLLAREIFFVATDDDLSNQNNEALWYPLSATTELLALVLFALAGLVPPRDVIKRMQQEYRMKMSGISARERESSVSTV